MSVIPIETAGRIIGALHCTSITCPHCGHAVDGSESEYAQHVVSYWGEEDHDLSCDECGLDFVVRENVMRSFETAASSDDFE